MPTTVLFPTGHVPGSRRLPVLMDPYGGPHGQRVLNSAHAYLASQWFADQGFVVIVCDGRGTAGNGPGWDRRASTTGVGTADDQADARPGRGRTVPRRPRHHPRRRSAAGPSAATLRPWRCCAILTCSAQPSRAPRPPTNGSTTPATASGTSEIPNVDPDVYDRNSVIPLAAGLTRPLMIIHGLADDNVYPAHALGCPRAAGRGQAARVPPAVRHDPHGHDEVVAENLLLLQVDFLRRSLDLT